MPCVEICPYFMRDKGEKYFYCECVRFAFPDKLAKRAIVYQYCAHPEGYKRCMIKNVMDDYYERKYQNEEEQQKKEQSPCKL